MPDSLKVIASVFLIAGGHFGLPLVLVTLACSRSVAPRAVTLVNFLLCWIVYATGYLMLVYANQQTGPEPEPILCIVQAAMIHASTPLVAFAAFALVLQLLDDLGHLSGGIRRIKTLQALILLSVPWIVFILFFVAVLSIGLAKPNLIYLKDSSYCTVRDEKILTMMDSACTILGLTGTLVFEILIVSKLHSHARKLSSSLSCSLPVSLHQMLIRLFVFTAYCVVAVFVTFALMFLKTSNASFVFLCSLPLIVFLVFGTQRDLLNVWFFWWKDGPEFVPEATSPSPPIQVKMTSQSRSLTSPAEMRSENIRRTDFSVPVSGLNSIV